MGVELSRKRHLRSLRLAASQLAQKRQNATTHPTAEYAELVLQAHDVHVAHIEKVRCAQIRRQVLPLDLEANDFGIRVASP
jgi:hypothetical protein